MKINIEELEIEFRKIQHDNECKIQELIQSKLETELERAQIDIATQKEWSAFKRNEADLLLEKHKMEITNEVLFQEVLQKVKAGELPVIFNT